MYHRYGHAKDLLVKVGDKVSQGQKIGTIGKGGVNNFSAHLHYDIPKNKLSVWTAFVIGKSKEWVKENYLDPEPYKYIVMPDYTHEGYGYLDDAQYPGGKAYHPGDDLNSGAGDSDLGRPFYSATDGVVVYAYNENGSNNGWGKLLVIEEVINNDNTMELTKDQKKDLAKLGFDFGDKINSSELDRLIKKALETPNCDAQNKEIDELKTRIKELEPKADIGNRFMEVTKMANNA